MKNRYNDIIKELSEKELLVNLYITQMLVLGASLVLGMILFDHRSDFFQLFHWSDSTVWIIGGGAGVIVATIDMILSKILPDHFYDDGGLNERIFRNTQVLHIALICAMVAFSEEVLFRGVIQTHIGLFFSSIIFAVIHFRYLFKWFLFLNIFLLSFLIGYIYMVTGNLSVTIFMHFVIDFLLGLSIRIKHYKTERNGRNSNE